MDWADRIGRRIKLRDLHIVLAVAECGSMAKASSQLSVSNPVVSKTILDLERTLGVRLFERGAQGVELTPHGAALLNCGVTVFNEMRHGLKLLEALSDPTSGELRIGSTEISMAGLLPPIVESFAKQYPRIRLHVVLAHTVSGLFQELRERNVDLVIGRVSRDLADDLGAEMLFEEPFLAVTGKQTRLARRRNVTLAELIDEPWVLPPYSSVPGALILELFRANNLPPPQPSVTTLSVQLTVTLIASGRFVGVLPSSVAQFNAGRAGLKILPLKFSPALPASIVMLKNRSLSPPAQQFVTCARQAIKFFNSAPKPTALTSRSA
jgi:DNA-binding transcriptional LysR family regulator